MIELEGTFDPQGKSQQEIGEAAAKGEILFGRSLNIPYDQNPKLYTLTPGVEIGNFEFFGKAAGDPIEPTHMINFIMPDTYRDPGGNNYPIPEGKEVNFYASLEAGGEIINFDYVFTGTTGGNIECDLPSSLIGEERYFYAVVVLEGDFDLEGKTQQETMDAVTEGKILFGRALGDEGEQKLYTLTPGVEIGNFEFFGKAAGDPIEPTHMINFIMPENYCDKDDDNYPIPAGKEVKFYTLLDAEAQTFNADHVFSAKTGSTKIQCPLPGSLIGQDRYIFAVIELEGEFDPQGKSQQEVGEAVAEGKILFGKALEDPPSRNPKLYTLTSGVEIGNFEFMGKHTISFIMPETYLSFASGNVYPIPAGKEVQFYPLEHLAEGEEGEEDSTYSADHVFTAETGPSKITCPLPESLIGEERYIEVIVVLEGTYDLRGKTQGEFADACFLYRKILLGNSQELVEYEGEQEWTIKKHTLSDGIEIGNINILGVGPDEPRYKIYFTLPDIYYDKDDEYKEQKYLFPVGKEVKIYAVERLEEPSKPIGAHHVFTGITGDRIECELPFYLLKDFLGRDYYFFAIVLLEGDFDLEGKTQQEIDDAVNEGKILFGRSLEHVPDGNPKPYPLTPDIEIGNFEFFGKAPGE